MNNQKYTLIIFTENKPGVLYRIADVFLRRKINIEKLHVYEIPEEKRSKFTIEIFTDEVQVNKLKNQIDKIVEVLEII